MFLPYIILGFGIQIVVLLGLVRIAGAISDLQHKLEPKLDDIERRFDEVVQDINTNTKLLLIDKEKREWAPVVGGIDDWEGE